MNPRAGILTREEGFALNPDEVVPSRGDKKRAWQIAETRYPGATVKFLSQVTGASVSSIWNWRWEHRHPERRFAHKAVERALAKGTIQRQPCHCGDEKSHAHHDDYDKPLVVRWLCDACHRAEHMK